MRHRKKITGTGERPRLNLFRSLKHISAQLINDADGKTLVSVSSSSPDLKDSLKGISKTEAAAAVGKQMGAKSKEMGITRVYFDIGPYKYHGRVKALAESFLESGVSF